MNHALRRNSDQENRPRTMSAIPEAIDSQASTIIAPAVSMPVRIRPPRSVITRAGSDAVTPPPPCVLIQPLSTASSPALPTTSGSDPSHETAATQEPFAYFVDTL